MVANSRAPLGARSLRALNEPVNVAVDADATGSPLAVRRSRWPAPRRVEQVTDTWRIDDEWWRKQAIARVYFTVLFDDGAVLTIYHDLLGEAWFEQHG